MKKVIVFGGSGFIGTRLIKRLVDSAAFDVISVDIREAANKLPGVTYITWDVRNLSGFAVEGEIEKIYHLAAVHTTPGHPDYQYYETNIGGATEVVSFANKNKVKSVIFTSSISVYGPGEDLKSELTAPTPQTAYGWSKYLSENIFRRWQESAADNELVIVRPAVVFGPNENGNFTRLIAMLKKGLFVYPGRKDTIKSCIFVEDLIDFIFVAEDKHRGSITFNGCYPERYTTESIVKAVKRSYFPDAKEYTLPRFMLMLLAYLLKPFSVFNLGIHPDRVTKLVRSTNIHPNWLLANASFQNRNLEVALGRWASETEGRFS